MDGCVYEMIQSIFFWLLCLPAVGLYVKEHCTANLQFGQCEPCNADTFSSHPTGQTYCEPCTSCSHVNGILSNVSVILNIILLDRQSVTAIQFKAVEQPL